MTTASVRASTRLRVRLLKICIFSSSFPFRKASCSCVIEGKADLRINLWVCAKSLIFSQDVFLEEVAENSTCSLYLSTCVLVILILLECGQVLLPDWP